MFVLIEQIISPQEKGLLLHPVCQVKDGGFTTRPHSGGLFCACSWSFLQVHFGSGQRNVAYMNVSVKASCNKDKNDLWFTYCVSCGSWPSGQQPEQPSGKALQPGQWHTQPWPVAGRSPLDSPDWLPARPTSTHTKPPWQMHTKVCVCVCVCVCVYVPASKLAEEADWCPLPQCPALLRALCSWCRGPLLSVLMPPLGWCSYCCPLTVLDPGQHKHTGMLTQQDNPGTSIPV